MSKQRDEAKFTVGIVGMGYVGLPLALQFTKHGNRVIGFDIDEEKIAILNSGRSYIHHISSQDIQSSRAGGLFEATCDFKRVAETNAIIICVPTPLTKNRDPDIRYILSTGEQIGRFLKAGQIVILESTTYPGTTEEDLQPVLEKLSGLRAGTGFHLAYSPEREDPGNTAYRTNNIPKLVGGMTPECTEKARDVYRRGGLSVVPVSTTRVAEAAKLLENIFRCVNIALVNEMKVVLDKMGIDVWEVINAAKTKPFGYMPFYPGPGLGGHCIPIDPFYLSWKAREFGLTTRFIELAGEVNTAMPHYVISKLIEALSENGKPLKGATVFLLGLAYKKGVDDARESPSFVLWEELEARGAKVIFHDPYIRIVPKIREHARFAGKHSTELTKDTLAGCDVVLISTDHQEVDYAMVARFAPLVVDTRNACGSLPPELTAGKVVKA